MTDIHVGCPLQLSGVEEFQIVGGKGDGMRVYEVRNEKGLDFFVLPQRGMDLGRLSFRGVNCSYLSAAGYVAPAYFQEKDNVFLKSFTCGFLTTCGLRQVGVPCVENGEALTLHGTISHIPASASCWRQREDRIEIHGILRDETLFGDKLVLERTIVCLLKENVLEIQDRIINEGDRKTPLMLLYHFNVGYPLLAPEAELFIGADRTAPRDAQAQKGIQDWHRIEEPQQGYQEQCFYHKMGAVGKAGVFHPGNHTGLLLRYDTEALPYFTQWKMMGVRDYVMGLEPGNCNPEGRKAWKEQGKLEYLQPGEEKNFRVRLDFFDCYADWQKAINERLEEW